MIFLNNPEEYEKQKQEARRLENMGFRYHPFNSWADYGYHPFPSRWDRVLTPSNRFLTEEDIDRILSNGLEFGNRGQIEALKAWECLQFAYFYLDGEV